MSHGNSGYGQVGLSVVPLLMSDFASKPDGVRFDNPDGSTVGDRLTIYSR